MRRTGLIAVALLAVMVGCSRGNDKMDQPLNNDLNLAAQQQPGQDTMSAAERNQAATATPAPSATAEHRTVHHTSSSSETSHRSTASSGTRSSSAGTASTASSATVTEKHTKRDAAIGAAAGAVLGAATSKDKVKGGIIGAAAGGILGGIIGNNVDVKKKKP